MSAYEIPPEVADRFADHDDAEQPPTNVGAAGRRRALTVVDILDQWRTEGPLVHEATGLDELDDQTGGGPVFGARWYLIGAPDAGKTALLIQVADVFASRGVAVGILAIDEEPGDVVMRLAQRRNVSRRECEDRSAQTIAAVKDALGDLPIRLYDASWTIEAAMEDLAASATSMGTRAAMFVDSIQTVECDVERGENPPRSVREAVTARVVAIRTGATRHRMFAMATSEMNRSAYRSVEAAEAVNDLASAKESGAIEYSARVLVALRSVPGESDLVELRIVKNKHGASGGRIGLRLSRAHMRLEIASLPEEPDRDAMSDERGHAKIAADAAIVARTLTNKPGATGRELYPAARVLAGTLSRDRYATAKAALAKSGAFVVILGSRRAELHYLDGSRLDEEVTGTLPLDERAAVIAARPPKRDADG